MNSKNQFSQSGEEFWDFPFPFFFFSLLVFAFFFNFQVKFFLFSIMDLLNYKEFPTTCNRNRLSAAFPLENKR